MPFVMNRDIPETYEELKQAFIDECKQRYEDIERARDLLGEEGQRITELKEQLEEEKEKWADTTNTIAMKAQHKYNQLERDYGKLDDLYHKLKEENKGLRNGGGNYISREEHQKVCDFLNAEAEMYKVKFMNARD